MSEEYLALPDGAGRFRQDSSGPALLRIPLVPVNLHLRGYHPLWLNFPEDSVWWQFLNAVLQPSSGTPPEFRLFPFRSPLLGESRIVFFSSPYLDVSVQEVGFPTQVPGWYAFSIPGCPIRKPADITLVCSSPQLIAAYRVLHRLSDPRHPPCALNCFKKIRNCSCYLRQIKVTRYYNLLSQYVKDLNANSH